MKPKDFTDKRNCVVFVPDFQCRVADRIEQYAFSHFMNVLETIMGDTKAVERLKAYIRSGSVQVVLVHQIKDIGVDGVGRKEIMQLADIHSVQILTEDTQYALAGQSENQNKEKYHTVTYPSETVVLNEKNQIPKNFPKGFPTEREAVEYIREQGKEECVESGSK